MKRTHLKLNLSHSASKTDREVGPQAPNAYYYEWNFKIDFGTSETKEVIKRIDVSLHETFENPKRVLTKHPYTVIEQGYGSFQLNRKNLTQTTTQNTVFSFVKIFL